MIQQEQLLRTFHPGMFSTPESVARRMQPKTINHRFIPDWEPMQSNELCKTEEL